MLLSLLMLLLLLLLFSSQSLNVLFAVPVSKYYLFVTLLSQASTNGATIVAWNDEANQLHIFDRGQKKLIHTLKPQQTAVLENDQVSLTSDGKYVLFKVEGLIFFLVTISVSLNFILCRFINRSGHIVFVFLTVCQPRQYFLSIQSTMFVHVFSTHVCLTSPNRMIDCLSVCLVVCMSVRLPARRSTTYNLDSNV